MFDWIGAHPGQPERVDALLRWVQAVCVAPMEVSTGEIRNTARNRSIYYSDVPTANSRVTYQIIDVPARCVHILRINDEDFGLPSMG